MTTQTIEKGEDLIILGDDNSVDDSILDFDFGKTSDSEVSLSDNFLINFDEVDKKEVGSELILQDNSSFNISNIQESPTKDTIIEDSLFSFNEDDKKNETGKYVIGVNEKIENSDLIENSNNLVNFGFDSVTIENNVTDILPEEKKINEKIDLGNDNILNNITKTEEKTIENVVLTESFDRDSILNEAIYKMQQRKGIILENRQNKQSEVDVLNLQISDLKEKVFILENQIKDLEKEDIILDTDVLSIEEMKTNILEVSQERPRKHNLDNIKKK